MLNPIPELTPLLKQLRLSGMTETLATRNREAIEHQLSHPEFLALLVQDEVARRDQKNMLCVCDELDLEATKHWKASTWILIPTSIRP